MNLPLDSRQLRAFSVLAGAGSFTLAAKELFLSQSAVSHSMKALEADVGCRLFDRVGKKVFLTQAGEQLMQHAEKILKEMGDARASLEHLGQWGKKRLRLGASTTACQYILPTVLREFKNTYDDCVILIEPVDTLDAVSLLRSNTIDLAVGLRPATDEQLEFVPLFEDELQFVVSASHPWALQGHVTRSEIPRQNYIFYSKRSHTFRLIESYFHEEEIVLKTGMELGSIEAIKELVKLDLGISILAPWVAVQEIEAGVLVSLTLGRRRLKRAWGIIHLKGRRFGLPEETFISQCRSCSRDFAAAKVPVLTS
jgi:DNA-binding transcriptional LysR family regulator